MVFNRIGKHFNEDNFFNVTEKQHFKIDNLLREDYCCLIEIDNRTKWKIKKIIPMEKMFLIVRDDMNDRAHLLMDVRDKVWRYKEGYYLFYKKNMTPIRRFLLRLFGFKLYGI